MSPFEFSEPLLTILFEHSYAGPATSARYFGVQFYLEDLLGQSVDLVTDKALREELRPFIEREAVNV